MNRISGKNFGDPELSDEDADRIVGSFIRKREDGKLRTYWSEKLARDHGVTRNATEEAAPGQAIRKSLPGRTFIYLLAAVAVVLLLFLAFPSWGFSPGEDLVTQAISDANIFVTRSAPSDRLAVLRGEFALAYAAGEFPQAVVKGKEMVDFYDATPYDKLNLGIALLKADDPEEALEIFNEFITPDNNFRIEATYYSGLALLANNRVDEGLERLRQITPEDAGRFYTLAQQILSEDW